MEFGIPNAVELGYENVIFQFMLLMGGLMVAVAFLLMELVKYWKC
jgi:hypothetical protein